MLVSNRLEQSVSRRDALGAISGTTVALSGYGSAVSVVSAEGTTTDIVTLAKGGSAAKSVSVSKEWYEQVKSARKANEQVTDRFLSMKSVVRVGIETDDYRIGGLPAQRVAVGVDPAVEGAPREKIPTEVGGVPVVVHETASTVPTCGSDSTTDCYVGKYTAYGGLAVTVSDSSGFNVTGTSCCRAYKNGNEFLLTAKHLFTEEVNKCSDNIVDGAELTLSGGAILKEPDHLYSDSDAALVGGGGTEITNDIVEEPDKGIVGRVTVDGLSYLQSTGKIVEKRGRCTCRTDGRVKQYGGSESCGVLAEIKEIVTSSLTQKKRDSGGPVYYEPSTSTDELYLVNMAMGHPQDDTSRTIGTSAAYLEGKHGVSFGGATIDG